MVVDYAKGMQTMRYLEERTGLSFHRLCGPQRFGAGVAIVLTGMVLQVANFV